jgi:hypothetical protein
MSHTKQELFRVCRCERMAGDTEEQGRSALRRCLTAAFIQNNAVWNFYFVCDGVFHAVRFGDYATCVCDEFYQHHRLCAPLLLMADQIFVKPLLAYKDCWFLEAKGFAVKCPICQDTQPWSQRGKGLTFCQHCQQPFHEHCVQSWANYHSSCPTCREPVSFGFLKSVSTTDAGGGEQGG